MSLSDALKKWAESPKGKEKIKSAKNNAAQTGVSFGDKPGGGAPEDVSYYADWARTCIENAIAEASVMAESLYEFAEHLVQSPPRWDAQKERWVVEFVFEDTERDSLDPDTYPSTHPDHIQDIVALLNHGYDADGTVYGYWETAGQRVRSLQSRDGLYFIQHGAHDFNARFDEIAEMQWHPKYDGGPIDQAWEE